MSTRKVEIPFEGHRYAAELHDDDSVTIWRDDQPIVNNAWWDGMMIWGYDSDALGDCYSMILDLLEAKLNPEVWGD